ncbi:MAG TPA: VOC family protein [Chloroflexota bacterium]|jgi:catechol 2,3-dioxygenase-like lactoylglutathione lyase family enzyme|nr:VOC family protein [Chloroflexota bacterium]
MAKIRHIAIRAEDVEKTAAFFQDAFGLQFVQRRGSGPIDLSDGDINITLLPLSLPAAGREVQPGFEHIGFTVEDEAATRQRLIEQGATELNPINLGDVYYEAKYLSAEGLIVDVGHWAGTSPIQTPEGSGVATSS